jgi:hypothetical protein
VHHTNRAQKKKPASTLSTPLILLHEALKHDLHIINPTIAQILHAGDGLQVWGICRSDASKV